MRVLICGDRNWTDYSRIFRFVASLPTGSIIIEGAARGADFMAGQAAREVGFQVLEFPANWAKFGRAAGPIRNVQMMTEGKPDVVVAFHDDLEHSKGTRDMVNRAKKAGLPVYVNPNPYEVKDSSV